MPCHDSDLLVSNSTVVLHLATHGFGFEQNLQSSIFREKLALYVLVHYYNADMSMSLLILNRYFSTKFQASSHYFDFLTDLKYKIGVEL